MDYTAALQSLHLDIRSNEYLKQLRDYVQAILTNREEEAFSFKIKKLPE